MVEKDIQNVLFKKLVEQRSTFRIGIPNIYFYRWESDFLGLTRSGYCHEFEIKVSKEDYLADFNKKHKHNLLSIYHKSPSPTHVIPKRFYYVISGFWLEMSEVPAYAGLLIVTPSGYIKTIKRAPDLPATPVTEDNLLKIATSACYRLMERW